MIIWGDATMSDFEFKVRRAFYFFCILVLTTVLVIDMGRLIKDVESVVVAFDSTDGVYMTTAEDVALANTTNDSPFMVTRHVYLRSTGSTRISFATIYLIYFFVKSMTAPEEVSAPLALSRALTLLFTNEFESLPITCTRVHKRTPPLPLPTVPNPEGCAGSHRWSTGGGAARQCLPGGNTVRPERRGADPSRRTSPASTADSYTS
mmetsp:Transcript_96320/g.274440  ORF Transcript_96320/g.274440 Transcript_96320/m.274440 type:complete len:206 (-) Transcript_96320:1095-1712(-)